MSSMASQKPRRPRTRGPRKAQDSPWPSDMLILDIEKHGGRWVASQRGKVVAVADSFTDIELKVAALGIANDVILTRVPRTGAIAL